MSNATPEYMPPDLVRKLAEITPEIFRALMPTLAGLHDVDRSAATQNMPATTAAARANATAVLAALYAFQPGLYAVLPHQEGGITIDSRPWQKTNLIVCRNDGSIQVSSADPNRQFTAQYQSRTSFQESLFQNILQRREPDPWFTDQNRANPSAT